MLIEYIGKKKRKVFGDLVFEPKKEFGGKKVCEVANIKDARYILKFGDVFRKFVIDLDKLGREKKVSKKAVREQRK